MTKFAECVTSIEISTNLIHKPAHDKMQERIYVSDFMLQQPYTFWVIIHLAWGAIYGGLIVSTIALHVSGKREFLLLKKKPISTILAQMVWATLQVLGVFCIPLLIGAFDRSILGSGHYILYTVFSWILTIYCAWFLSRSTFKWDDIN